MFKNVVYRPTVYRTGGCPKVISQESDDIVNKTSVRRKKSSHSKGCCSFSNSKDIQSDTLKEDKYERRKNEKTNSSPFTKSRNNMRVMLSKFIANNNRGKHERDT